jgi:hypothetical protein
MHENKKIPNVYCTKFLGLMLHNTPSWKIHIDTILPKLSSPSFALRVVKPLLSQDLTENGILFIFSFYNALWINILGEFPS